LIAAINGSAARTALGLEAIQSLRQRQRQRLKVLNSISGKQIGMSQSLSFERSLQQLHTLRLTRKIFECHCSTIIAKSLESDN
jgi:hypothetical protein